MPTIRERDPDLVYTRAERESGWAAFLLCTVLLVTLVFLAFVVLARDQDRRALMDQLNSLRLQQSTQPAPAPVIQPVPVPVPQTVTVPVPTPTPSPAPSNLGSGSGTNRDTTGTETETTP